VPNLAHFGNHFTTNNGTFWHANFRIDPKLAETAPLLYRATDVPFLQRMGHWAKISRTHFLLITAHFQLIRNWQEQHPCSIWRLMCHSAKNGTTSQSWQNLFSTNYGTFPIDPKLAETATQITQLSLNITSDRKKIRNPKSLTQSEFSSLKASISKKEILGPCGLTCPPELPTPALRRRYNYRVFRR